MALRAALLRISKDDAHTGLAVERQRDDCLAIIARENLELVQTYMDNGVSAYNRNLRRPLFDQMTRDYEAGKFDVVVCWDMDRFSRQPAQLEHWIELGEARGQRGWVSHNRASVPEQWVPTVRRAVLRGKASEMMCSSGTSDSRTNGSQWL